MKKYFKFYLMLAVMATSLFISCDDNDNNEGGTGVQPELVPIIDQYVNKTVIPTYKNLADATIELVEKLKVLKENKSDANVVIVANSWIETRYHWELSEAFLFGAVSDFGIDPHIDTWPLDIPSLVQELNNSGHIESMAAEDGDVWAGEHLGNALLGFHGIEYIIFSNGAPKTASTITDTELIYAIAVAGDLRNKCVQLEASWAGFDGVTEEKQTIVDDLGLAITPSNSEWSYGENMLNAGLPGSTYRTTAMAVAQILSGAFDIADEVGNVKIGTAANEGSDDFDKDYIESPFSHNSLKDFEDNIMSIENTYLGGAYGKRDEAKSVSRYVARLDADVDADVKAAIIASYAAIAEIKKVGPFVNSYNSAAADAAVIVIGETLANALTAAKDVVLEAAK